MTRTLLIVVGIFATAGGSSLVTAMAQIPAQAPTQSSTDLTSKVDALFAPGSRPGSPGLVCSVMRDGKTLYANGHGLADLERNVPITAESVFYIGSMFLQSLFFSPIEKTETAIFAPEAAMTRSASGPPPRRRILRIWHGSRRGKPRNVRLGAPSLPKS